MLRILKFIKDILFIFPVFYIFRPLTKFFLFIAYYNKMIYWIYSNKKKLLFSDFYSPIRNYKKRVQLHEFVSRHFSLNEQQIVYLEFGVASGTSFNWWLNENKNAGSEFFGFDTFEGLPEDWGVMYNKGDMASAVPALSDNRGHFLKGLFQDTLTVFLAEKGEMVKKASRRVIHMDADLYSATAFALSQLYPFLKKGDLILFDEFNVPLHEFKAFLEFTENFYIKLAPVAAVNNFYQTAFIVE